MHFSSALYVHTRHTGFFSIGVGICTPVLPPRDIQYKYTTETDGWMGFRFRVYKN